MPGFEVTCGGAQHRLVVEGGRLVAPDHPDDEGEEVLRVLADATPRCLVVVEAWSAGPGEAATWLLSRASSEIAPSLDDTLDLIELPGATFPGFFDQTRRHVCIRCTPPLIGDALIVAALERWAAGPEGVAGEDDLAANAKKWLRGVLAAERILPLGSPLDLTLGGDAASLELAGERWHLRLPRSELSALVAGRSLRGVLDPRSRRG